MVLRPCQKLCHSGLTILPSKLPICITSTQGLGRVRLRQWLRGQHGQHVPGRLGRARARYQHRRGSCHLVRRLIEIECMAVVGRQSRARMCVCHACRGNLLLCFCCVSVSSRTLLCGRQSLWLFFCSWSTGTERLLSLMCVGSHSRRILEWQNKTTCNYLQAVLCNFILLLLSVVQDWKRWFVSSVVCSSRSRMSDG